MRILWLNNRPLPAICRAAGLPETRGETWLSGWLEPLLADTRMRVGVCAPAGCRWLRGTTAAFDYFLFPLRHTDGYRYNVKLENAFSTVLKDFKPDVVHICGSEYPHALAMARACAVNGLLSRTVLSIQGLVSEIAGHADEFHPQGLQWRPTLRDRLRGESPEQLRERLSRRGAYERAVLQTVRHVAGRTAWDEACVRRIQPDIHYHVLQESLRPAFYEGEWTLPSCRRHLLFVPQAYELVKGFGYLLEALPSLQRQFPQLRVEVAGRPLTIGGWRETGYACALARRIRELGLTGCVRFLGHLSDGEMRKALLRAHAMALPSILENSSNALGEAMLLGTPVVGTAAGGIPSLLQQGEEGLLCSPADTAGLIKETGRLLSDDALAVRLSAAARRRAAKRYDRRLNGDVLLSLYRQLWEEPG